MFQKGHKGGGRPRKIGPKATKKAAAPPREGGVWGRG